MKHKSYSSDSDSDSDNDNDDDSCSDEDDDISNNTNSKEINNDNNILECKMSDNDSKLELQIAKWLSPYIDEKQLRQRSIDLSYTFYSNLVEDGDCNKAERKLLHIIEILNEKIKGGWSIKCTEERVCGSGNIKNLRKQYSDTKYMTFTQLIEIQRKIKENLQKDEKIIMLTGWDGFTSDIKKRKTVYHSITLISIFSGQLDRALYWGYDLNAEYNAISS